MRTQVVLSDYDDPTLIDNLRLNIDLAFPGPGGAPTRARLSACGHSWGDASTIPSLLSCGTIPAATPRHFSRILLADTLWYSAGHLLLLDSLNELLARTPTARVCIVAGFHSGRATPRSFLRKAGERGLVRRGRWQEVGTDGRRREWGWDLRRKEGDADREGEWEEVEDASERNKWVVEGELGWSDEALRGFEGQS